MIQLPDKEKLHDIYLSVITSLGFVSVMGLILTGVLSVLKVMAWQAGLFLLLEVCVAILFGCLTGFAMAAFAGREKSIVPFFLPHVTCLAPIVATSLLCYLRLFSGWCRALG